MTFKILQLVVVLAVKQLIIENLQQTKRLNYEKFQYKPLTIDKFQLYSDLHTTEYDKPTTIDGVSHGRGKLRKHLSVSRN